MKTGSHHQRSARAAIPPHRRHRAGRALPLALAVTLLLGGCAQKPGVSSTTSSTGYYAEDEATPKAAAPRAKRPSPLRQRYAMADDDEKPAASAPPKTGAARGPASMKAGDQEKPDMEAVRTADRAIERAVADRTMAQAAALAERMKELSAAPGATPGVTATERAWAERAAAELTTLEREMREGEMRERIRERPRAMQDAAERKAERPTMAAPAAERTVQKLRVVKLFFATDRKWTGATEQPKWFGPEWNDWKLTYGTCVVSIPPKHQPGGVEKPSIFRFELTENPDKHVIVHKPKRLEEAPYFAALRAEVKARPQKEITVFIHGFNNTFDAAASRLGVLAFDMDFNGVPVLYSWSSRGGGWGTKAYGRDEEIVVETIKPLAGFLASVADEGRAAGAERINVVAHSMGNRALLGALQLLAEKPGRTVLNEVVMAAPDVKKLGFAGGVWPNLKTPAKRYTLYASDDDRALKASKEAHEWPRIGQAGEDLLLLEGLDTVDATGCDFSMLGLNHSYFGSPEVVEDLKALLSKALTPAARKLREKKRQMLLYWLLPEIKPPNP